MSLTVLRRLVSSAPSISNLTATPSTLQFGGGQVVIDAAITGSYTSLTLDGVAVTLPTTQMIAVNHTFMLIATNANGSDTKTITVTVGAAPQPTGDFYPTYHTLLTDAQYVWSDMPAAGGSDADTGATWNYQNLQGEIGAQVVPGFYVGGNMINASVFWRNKGGDWADVNGTAQGNSPFATAAVPGAHSAQWVTWSSSNYPALLQLVRDWIGGTKRNAGWMLRGDNGNGIIFSTRFGTNPPQLTLTVNGTPTTLTQSGSSPAVGRSLQLVNDTGRSQGGAVTMQTVEGANPSRRSLVWFDLSAFTDAAAVTAVTLSVYSTDQFGAQNVGLYRVVNPEDPANVGPQVLGLAQSFPLDVDIETHGDVMYVERFEDATYVNRMLVGTKDPGSVIVTASDNNGFFLMPGSLGALKVHYTQNGANAAFNAYWSPSRSGPTVGQDFMARLKAEQDMEEGYFRYYLLWGNDWDPSPYGGKMPGFDLRYIDLGYTLRTVDGMGRGNSNSGADGGTGGSARGNMDKFYTPGSPLELLRGTGAGDMYCADQVGGYGINCQWRNYYLPLMAKGRWNCIESHLKLNTVTLPLQKPQRLYSLTHVNGLATATLYSPPDDLAAPYFVPGQDLTIGGVVIDASGRYGYDSTGTGYGGNGGGYQGRHTVISTGTDGNGRFYFTYNVSPNCTSPAQAQDQPGRYYVTGSNTVWLWASASQANRDGVNEAWINGYYVGGRSDIRFRHSRYRTDGGIFGIDNFWYSFYEGGEPKPDRTFSCYIDNAVVAKSYIGPMAMPSTVPAWLEGVNVGEWTQIPNTSFSNLGVPGYAGILSSPDYGKLVSAGLSSVSSARTNIGYGKADQGPFAQGGGTLRNRTTMVIYGGGGANTWAGNNTFELDVTQGAPVWRIPYSPTPASHILPFGDSRYGSVSDPTSPTWFNHYSSTTDPAANQLGDPTSLHTCARVWCIDSQGPIAGSLLVLGFGQGWNKDADYDPYDTSWNRIIDSLDYATGTWRARGTHANYPTPFEGRWNVYHAKHPVTEEIYGAYASNLYKWDPLNPFAAPTFVRTVPWLGWDHGVCAIDPNNNILLRMGPAAGGNVGAWNAMYIDLDDIAGGVHTCTLTGSGVAHINTTGIGIGMGTVLGGFVYDEGLQAFLLFQGSGWVLKITQQDANTFRVDDLVAADATQNPKAPPNDNAAYGTAQQSLAGRMQYIPSLKGICIIFDSEHDAYFLRTSS